MMHEIYDHTNCPINLDDKKIYNHLFDENKNGIWDAGKFFGKHKQPELVKPIERKITVKANWENEFDISL